MKNIYCKDCSNLVSNDEIALNIKVFGKQIGTVRCYECLAEFLSCKTIKLKKLSEYYKKTGCSIFQTKFTD